LVIKDNKESGKNKVGADIEEMQSQETLQNREVVGVRIWGIVDRFKNKLSAIIS